MLKNINYQITLLTNSIFISFILLFGTVAYAEVLVVREFSDQNEVKKIFGEIPYIKESCLDVSTTQNSTLWYEMVKGLQLSVNVEKFKRDVFTVGLQRIKNIKSNSPYKFKGKNKKRKIHIKLNQNNCVFKGKYRITGDMEDHAGALQQFPHSIKVKLSSGSFGNITKFKLFTLKSRCGKNEVIASQLFKHMGFLAPRTALIDVKLAGEYFPVIFQEDISKEFLEYNNVHEALLFEGDEKFGLAAQLGTPRLINDKLLSSDTNINILNTIFPKLSEIYLKSGLLYNTYNPKSDTKSDRYQPTDPIVNSNFFDENSQPEILLFNMLSYAVGGIGGLSKDDHRFVFDHVSRTFRPIYYDPHLLECSIGNALFNFQVPFWFSASDRLNLKERINTIDSTLFINDLSKLGVKIDKNLFVELTSKIISNLNSLMPSSSSKFINTKVTSLDRDEILLQWTKVLNEIPPRHKGLGIQDWSFTAFTKDNELEKCYKSNSIIKCEILDIKLDYNRVLNSLIGEDLKRLKSHTKHSIYSAAFNENDSQYFLLDSVQIPKTDGVVIKYTNNLDVQIIDYNKTIHILSKNNQNNGGQVIFENGKLDGWNIKVSEELRLGYTPQANDRRSNLGYTGCLTMHDIILQNVEIELPSANCEDGIHFVRVSGEGLSIKIKNAMADGLDIDFSNISFEGIQIADAGNDCLDLSGGKYRIKNSNFEYCGDKGISAGESSSVMVNNTRIKKARVGIVAKDSSIIKLQSINIIDTYACMASYRKKQEFIGGTIKALDVDCDGSNSYFQKGSMIIQ